MTNVKPKSVPEQTLTDEQKAQNFIKEYSTLCEKHRYQIVVNPAFKSRDDSTFSVVLQTSVGKLPKQPERASK